MGARLCFSLGLISAALLCFASRAKSRNSRRRSLTFSSFFFSPDHSDQPVRQTLNLKGDDACNYSLYRSDAWFSTESANTGNWNVAGINGEYLSIFHWNESVKLSFRCSRPDRSGRRETCSLGKQIFPPNFSPSRYFPTWFAKRVSRFGDRTLKFSSFRHTCARNTGYEDPTNHPRGKTPRPVRPDVNEFPCSRGSLAARN